MFKMHYFTNILENRQALGALCSQRPLTFDIGDRKLCDLAKLCFHCDYDEIELLKISYDVISVTSPK